MKAFNELEDSIKLNRKKTGKDIHKDNRTVQKREREVEKAGRALSTQHQVFFVIFQGECCESVEHE